MLTQSCIRLMPAIAFAAAFTHTPDVFAQASTPVVSSVFTHQAKVDDGAESGAINDNWKFITNPPPKPVAASAPGGASAPHHGRGMGGGQGHGMRGTSSASNDGSTPPGPPPDGAGPGAGMSPGAGSMPPPPDGASAPQFTPQ